MEFNIVQDSFGKYCILRRKKGWFSVWKYVRLCDINKKYEGKNFVVCWATKEDALDFMVEFKKMKKKHKKYKQ